MSHKFSSFSALLEEIASHYTQLIKSMEDKITEMCKVSKQTWQKLDDVEVICSKWIEEIKRNRDDQVIGVLFLLAIETFSQNFSTVLSTCM